MYMLYYGTVYLPRLSWTLDEIVFMPYLLRLPDTLRGVSRASDVACRYLKPDTKLKLIELTNLTNQQFFKKTCTVDLF